MPRAVLHLRHEERHHVDDHEGGPPRIDRRERVPSASTFLMPCVSRSSIRHSCTFVSGCCDTRATLLMRRFRHDDARGRRGGGGPGAGRGVRRAASSREAGLDVVGVERGLVGGECPFYGCIPSKMMIRAADALAEARRVDALAGHAEVRPDWGTVATRIRDEATDDWDDDVAVERLEEAGVAVRPRPRPAGRPGPGRGSATTSTSRRAAWSSTPAPSPAVPPIDGLADTPYWTNREVDAADRGARRRWSCIGGGAIGCELAQAFAQVRGPGDGGRGRRPAPRRRRSPRRARSCARVFARRGHRRAHRGRRSSGCDHDGGFHAAPSTAQELERRPAARGRRAPPQPRRHRPRDRRAGPERPRSLEHRRADARRGAAVGGRRHHRQGRVHPRLDVPGAVAVRDMLGEDGPWADYRAVSRVTFTDPEVGAVGLTESQARDAGLDGRPSATPTSRESSRGWIHKAGNEGVIKLVADADRGVLVGGTAVGPVRRRGAGPARGRRARRGPGRDAARRCTSPTRPSTARSRRRWPTWASRDQQWFNATRFRVKVTVGRVPRESRLP